MGEKIRKLLKKANLTAEIIKDKVENGGLVQDFISESMVGCTLQDKLTKRKRKHIILNGFPRTLSQAKYLLKIANTYDMKVNVIFIKITQKVALERVKNRREKGRTDDSDESIRMRFKSFRKNKKPLIPFFTKNFNLIRIDGSGTKDEVDLKILKALGLVSNQGELFVNNK